MSFIKASTPFTHLRQAVSTARLSRSLSTTGALRHGESHNYDPQYKIDKLKESSLKQQKMGHGEWMQELASDSENCVKADRSAFDPKDAEHVAQTQKTIKSEQR